MGIERESRSKMLERVEVVQAGHTVAACAAGSALLKLGAHVSVLRPTATRDEADFPSNTQRERLMSVLDRGKTVVTLNSLDSSSHARPWASPTSADLLIIDITEEEQWQGASGVDRYLKSISNAPYNVISTISPFGLIGAHRGFRGTEVTFLASGGILHYSPARRTASDRPIKPAGSQASFVLGHVAALAGLHGIKLHRGTGRRTHLDVSAQDSVLTTGVFLECAHALFDCPGAGGAARFIPPRGIYPTTDGAIYLMSTEEHHWRGCVRIAGIPPNLARLDRSGRQIHGDEIDALVRTWTAQRSSRECTRALQEEGVPALPVNSCADLLRDESLEARSFFEDGTRPGEKLPGLPVKVVPDPAGQNSESSTPTLRHTEPDRPFRVLDLTHVLAGPLATSWLGTMGAEVIKIEDPNRVDHYRRAGPFCDGVTEADMSAYFAIANYSKRSVSLELDSPTGRAALDYLIRDADLLVENMSASRASRLRLSPDTVTWVEKGTDLLSSSAFGRSSPYAAYRAYGNNIHGAGGLIYLTRDASNGMCNVGTSWADPVTAVWIALIAMARQLDPSHSGNAYFDIGMVEVVAYQFAEFFSFLTADGATKIAHANGDDEYAPNGVYRCDGDDQWVAISVRSDQEWASLVRVLGSPEQLCSERFGGVASRRANSTILDEAMEGVTRRFSAEDLFLKLQDGGIAACPVWSAGQLVNDRHLKERGVFPTIEHPRMGVRKLVGLPWRSMDDGPFGVGRPRLFGEDTPESGVSSGSWGEISGHVL